MINNLKEKAQAQYENVLKLNQDNVWINPKLEYIELVGNEIYFWIGIQKFRSINVPIDLRLFGVNKTSEGVSLLFRVV